MTTELLETPVQNAAEVPQKKAYKYKYIINYGTYARTTGYDPIYAETVDEEEVFDSEGNHTGRKKRTVRRRVVDYKARPPEVFRAKVRNSKTGQMARIDPSDNDLIETDIELDREFPSMASTDYPLRKFQRIDGGALTGKPETDAAIIEAYERGKREILAAMAAKGIALPEDSVVQQAPTSPVEDAEVNSDAGDTVGYMKKAELIAHAAQEEIDISDCRTEAQMRKRLRESM